MNRNTRSMYVAGSDGLVIEIECHFSNGLPGIIIVGLGNKVVEESKERIRSAFASCKLELPRKRITINLAPADIPKESTSFDLAIAAAIILSAHATADIPADLAIIGELGLSGDVRPVRGIIGKIVAGKRLSINKFVVPRGNLGQASLVPGATIHPISNLKELYESLANGQELPIQAQSTTVPPDSTAADETFSSIAGQQQAKRALEIAAAGGHNILLSGPPGTGKSMLAKALANILPPLGHQEMLEATHLHSLASQAFDQLIVTRPFRAPHHSASNTSIIGGGTTGKPGEISLSHSGVLFLDEMPEFGRTTLEALRQPLEDRIITIARAKQVTTYPANFILVATANPCPCGYLGSSKECICSPSRILAYQRKLSGPILDRIDLFVEVSEVEHAKLLGPPDKPKQEEQIRQRVMLARQRQLKRLGSDKILNSSMDNRVLKQFCDISKPAKELLDTATAKLDVSARSYIRILKVSRTIADLENSEMITPAHVSEALQYRQMRRSQQ